MHKFGEVVLTSMQFVDTFEVKKRPALVLFEEQGNIVVAAITSNSRMKGVPLYKKEGAFKDGVIKLNYIFTVSDKMIEKIFFTVSGKKVEQIRKEIVKRLN